MSVKTSCGICDQVIEEIKHHLYLCDPCHQDLTNDDDTDAESDVDTDALDSSDLEEDSMGDEDMDEKAESSSTQAGESTDCIEACSNGCLDALRVVATSAVASIKPVLQPESCLRKRPSRSKAK